jgi:hypothetical protein
MTEPYSKRLRLLQRTNQTPELMTGAARRDVAPVRLCARRVTAKTRDMRIQPRRNREPNAATISSMTTRTRSTTMFRVIKPRIKAAQRRKRFDLSTLTIGVTDRADLARWIRKLLGVATSARRVCSFARKCRLR